MIVFEKLQQVKEMITQLVIIIITGYYNYFKNYYNVLAINLSKQQGHDNDLKAIQQINLTGNLPQESTTFFITETQKKLF